MSNEIKLTRFNHSENIKLTGRPYVVFRANGHSYINKRAASLLNVNHGDIIALYHTPDLQNWYIGAAEIGVSLLKTSGLYRFCDTKLVKKIFTAYNITAKKASFPISDTLQDLSGLKVLFIIPKPFNID